MASLTPVLLIGAVSGSDDLQGLNRLPELTHIAAVTEFQEGRANYTSIDLFRLLSFLLVFHQPKQVLLAKSKFKSWDIDFLIGRTAKYCGSLPPLPPVYPCSPFVMQQITARFNLKATIDLHLTISASQELRSGFCLVWAGSLSFSWNSSLLREAWRGLGIHCQDGALARLASWCKLLAQNLSSSYGPLHRTVLSVLLTWWLAFTTLKWSKREKSKIPCLLWLNLSNHMLVTLQYPMGPYISRISCERKHHRLWVPRGRTSMRPSCRWLP